MARRFNGSSDVIVFTLPTSLQTVVAGSTTLVAVLNATDGTDGALVHTRTSGGTNCWWMEFAGNVWNYGTGTTAKNVGGQTNGSWAAYVGRKTTGGANAPRGRKIVFGGATTDTTAGTGLVDGTAPGVGGILQVGKWGTASEFLNADIAAVAVFNSDLSDATTATFTTWAAILAAGPVWAVPFNQASATDPITDATGNGGNSSTITGTTIVSDPAGFFSSATDLSVGSGAVATAAGNVTLSAFPAVGSAAAAVAAAAVTLNARPAAGPGAAAVAAGGITLASSSATGGGAVAVGASGITLTSGSTLQAGGAAVGAASGNVGLTVGPSPGSAAVAVGGGAVVLSSTRTSGFGAVAVGASGITLTSSGATSLTVGNAMIAVGASDIRLEGGTVAQAQGSWYGLLGILDEIRQNHAEQVAAPPVACPLCGEPLEAARGVLHCRFEGWTTADQPL